MSDSMKNEDVFSDSESDVTTSELESEPMYSVLAQFLVTDKNKNIACVMADIAKQLQGINQSLAILAATAKF